MVLGWVIDSGSVWAAAAEFTLTTGEDFSLSVNKRVLVVATILYTIVVYFTLLRKNDQYPIFTQSWENAIQSFH